MVKREKTRKHSQGGFATVVSSVIALSIGMTGLYIVNGIRHYKKEEVIKQQAEKTADKIIKIEKAINTYMAFHTNADPSSITCQTLVNANLLSPNDCKDPYGQIQFGHQGGDTGDIVFKIPAPAGISPDDMTQYYQKLEDALRKDENEINNTGAQYKLQLS